jgi:hypothetical protein
VSGLILAQIRSALRVFNADHASAFLIGHAFAALMAIIWSRVLETAAKQIYALGTKAGDCHLYVKRRPGNWECRPRKLSRAIGCMPLTA